MKKIRTCGIGISIVFITLLLLSQNSSAQPYACIPSCIENDAKMLVFAAGATLQTINDRNVEVQIISPSTSDNVEIGIFDGDDLQIFEGQFNFTHWDKTTGRPPVVLSFRLVLDPDGNGTGNGVTYEVWSSDGSFGNNTGDPMPDAEWFTRVLPNLPEAQTADGSYSYRLEVSVSNPDPNPAGEAFNAFKLRTDGVISIVAGSAFNYIAPLDNFLDFIEIYPNIDFFSPECIGDFPAGGYCNPYTDPDCCLNPTNYDGRWEFCFMVPEGLNTLDVWDGDLDYGSNSTNPVDPFICDAPDGVSLDTDDPNTPIPLPPWSIGTDVVTQSASVPTAPPDDSGCFVLFLRPPSVNYNLVGPNGESYTNVNPSGNLEWELFNISTEPFDRDLYDIHVDNIESGLWCVEVFGNDVRNLNSFRLPYATFGIDDEGNPVLPPEEPAPIPTLNELGMLAFVLMTLFISVFYLKRRRINYTEK